MSVFLLLLILSEVLLPNLTCASRVRRQTTKVRISAIGDTIMLKFLQPHMDTKLEGYILGYGSNLFSKQFIQLPEDGEPYETEIDAEPKYLVAVQPVKEEEVKKQCAGKETLERPLHLVIGSVTPTSVMLSWGTLLNTLSSETNLDDCIEDGHFTVRYREKEPKKKWNYQTCPTTETIIDRLKPDTPYEFGVRAESGNINGAWSPPVIHNTADDIDIHEPVKPENFPRPKKPVTESSQTFSPSVPLLYSVTQSRPASLLRPPPSSPTQRVTQEDISNHKTLKPENFLGSKVSLSYAVSYFPPLSMFLSLVFSLSLSFLFFFISLDVSLLQKPITESPQAFSPSVPLLPRVTQSRPASLLKPPAPSPIPRVTLDIHKPLKPEIFLKPEKPITESPPAFSASVPFLPSETQSSLTSDIRNPAAPPTQRVIQVTDIHKPLKPESVLRPKKPVTESPQTFSPSVPLLPRVTQSRPASLLRPPAPSPIPRVTLGQDMPSPSASVARTSAPTVTKRVSPVSVLNPIRLPPTYSNTSVRTAPASHNEKHKGQLWDKPIKRPRKEPDLNEIKKQKNKVPKNGGKGKTHDKVVDLKVVDALPFQKPSDAPPTTELYQKPTPATTPFFAFNGSRYYMGDNSSVFSSVPVSEVDPMGKKRFVAPHVIYQIDKPPEQPCSVTHSLSFFPDEENGVANISGPPKTPPTNVTVVTVEGCPSFVIVDWEKTDNETTEYEVTSSVINPNGQVVSVVKTNQTHAAVENLKPESSYEFTVTPKNELGSGPSSEPVSFSTESADPRVREVQTGKNAIWSSFSFDADSFSECTGTQYVKRTWYRKFVGIQLCNSLRYKIYLSDSLKGKFYNIGDETGYGEDHCQFVDSFLDGRTGSLLPPHQLPLKQGYFRSIRQEPVKFGKIGGRTQINYVSWYECGVPIPGSW
ncbi:target of Nesh-SH3 isoform X2 [Ictalurus furcatus]|uniref:target of Nesh-SH3 isoform X2 n=1 Tax=Ictalurus furcatus TaxID=66913 RepID=UPI00235070CA|nr:target of Nesh-SH3 isoform X2 [Ictalurus furcatus]